MCLCAQFHSISRVSVCVNCQTERKDKPSLTGCLTVRAARAHLHPPPRPSAVTCHSRGKEFKVTADPPPPHNNSLTDHSCTLTLTKTETHGAESRTRARRRTGRDVRIGRSRGSPSIPVSASLGVSSSFSGGR